MELEAAIALNDERCINQYLFDFQRQVMPNLTTGLMYCAVYNRSGLFKYFKHQLFQKSKQKWTAFMFAAEYNSIQMLNLLRKEANFQDVSGFSALMRASIRGNIESVQFIVKNASEIGLKLTRNANGYRIGMNALALAAAHNQTDIVKLLTPFEIFQLEKTIIEQIFALNQNENLCNFLLSSLKDHHKKSGTVRQTQYYELQIVNIAKKYIINDEPEIVMQTVSKSLTNNQIVNQASNQAILPDNQADNQASLSNNALSINLPPISPDQNAKEVVSTPNFIYTQERKKELLRSSQNGKQLNNERHKAKSEIQQQIEFLNSKFTSEIAKLHPNVKPELSPDILRSRSQQSDDISKSENNRIQHLQATKNMKSPKPNIIKSSIQTSSGHSNNSQLQSLTSILQSQECQTTDFTHYLQNSTTQTELVEVIEQEAQTEEQIIQLESSRSNKICKVIVGVVVWVAALNMIILSLK
ncbi:Ankyrin_repeat-containing protein [Hexamita inflata]|uniref:Ankyrin repeat-containing protein n=1 Tax=Hexamita inflata TaxID=28002 RepID=A0AA86Q906_9EUKA|nr:Ankyrin repeat-containing protein [Hexamita inflata]